MFGYVKTYQPELKMGEFEQYRGVYCTLCKVLGKRYGWWSRMTLSYDFTFMALFHMALSEDCPGFENSRCTFNPTKKCMRCRNTTALDQAADAAMLLVYYKLQDTLADDGFFKRLSARFTLLFARRAHRKAAKLLPELDRVMADAMARQATLEKEKCASVDKAADPTATMLAAIAALPARDEEEKALLERFGYCLGRWVYLIDALDDLVADLKSGNYNPYILSRQLTEGDGAAITATREYAVQSLNASAANCMDVYEQLTIRRFDGILRNVLQQGIPAQQQRIAAPAAENGEKTNDR